MKVLRSILGVVAGLIAISVIAEGIELLLVMALHGGAVVPNQHPAHDSESRPC